MSNKARKYALIGGAAVIVLWVALMVIIFTGDSEKSGSGEKSKPSATPTVGPGIVWCKTKEEGYAYGCVTDVVCEYKYDELGRPIEVIDHTDDRNVPNSTYEYTDGKTLYVQYYPHVEIDGKELLAKGVTVYDKTGLVRERFDYMRNDQGEWDLREKVSFDSAERPILTLEYVTDDSGAVSSSGWICEYDKNGYVIEKKEALYIGQPEQEWPVCEYGELDDEGRVVRVCRREAYASYSTLEMEIVYREDGTRTETAYDEKNVSYVKEYDAGGNEVRAESYAGGVVWVREEFKYYTLADSTEVKLISQDYLQGDFGATSHRNEVNVDFALNGKFYYFEVLDEDIANGVFAEYDEQGRSLRITYFGEEFNYRFDENGNCVEGTETQYGLPCTRIYTYTAIELTEEQARERAKYYVPVR
ncbi:MAG: hypothetical protein IKX54_01990 [Lachnospiraceae bacterium]|nr:hypothetical protein [Lachnospiraceae bacterium]